MAKKRFLVAGAGFRGFCDALELAKIEDSEVTIIESAPFFGGLMYSLEIEGFAVDKGVHVFDSIPKELAEIVTEIMEGQVHEIDFVSASAFNGKVTEGFSLPDLNSLDDESVKNQIREELLEMAKTKSYQREPKNLHETFEIRYGKTAADIFSSIFKNVYAITTTEVEPQAIAQTSMGRMKFLDDEAMLQLKRSDEWLESVLAARRKTVGKVDDFVSIYPSDGQAMKGWCDRAHKWLENKGIKVNLSEKIQTIQDVGDEVKVVTNKGEYMFDKVVWSNDNVAALGESLGMDSSEIKQYQHGTPMLFVTLLTEKDKIKDFTYLQNFDPGSITYRTAAAGRFSHQERDGISFITCECPAEMGSARWENPEETALGAWDEVKHLGIVAEDATLVKSNVIKIPTTFKLAKLNYSEKIAEFCDEIRNRTEKVHLRNVVPFFRRDIYLDAKKLRDRI